MELACHADMLLSCRGEVKLHLTIQKLKSIFHSLPPPYFLASFQFDC